MNFKHTVLLTAAIATLTGCAADGDKKSDAAAAAPADRAAAVEPIAAPGPLAAAPVVVASGEPTVLTTPAPAPITEVVPEPPAAEQPASPAAASPPPPAAAPPRQEVHTERSSAARAAAAGKPSTPSSVVLDRTPHVFNVTVETKDASHPNYGRGVPMGFVVDGTPGKELALTRGVTYTFAVRTGIQHDFYFTTSPIGRGAGTVTDGVVGQFIYNADAQFTPTASTPAVVYYECRNHKYMGGKIHVGNPGEKVALGLPSPEDDQKDTEVKRSYTADQVKQKLNFADMVIGSSAAAKRVAASGNADAKQFATQAQRELAQARSALGAGNNNAAMDGVDEALRLMHSATTLVPDETAAADQKAQYTALLDQVRGFESSYQRSIAQGIKPKAGAELDKNKFNRMMSDAEALAGKGQYGEATKQVEAANELLTAALSALLDSQTVVYEKNFNSPKEEYEYELSRYGSYAELVPVAIEQRHPTPQTRAMMDELTKRAQEIHDEGVGLAKKGDHKMAIMALQAATERVQKALRLAGVQ